jgi:predicted RecB family nuclease
MLHDSLGEGLCRLSSPTPGDIFLDLEGDPFVGEGGIEYLFGIVSIDENGNLGYQYRWALNRAQERSAFEWLIDLIFEHVASHPDLHVYHFGAYEVGAIKRLMLRYATREEEVDRLLRGEIFTDLHIIVKKSVRASVEQYSLKEMEKFCGYERTVPLAGANQARRVVEHQLELASPVTTTDEACTTIEGYNQDDCRALSNFAVG